MLKYIATLCSTVFCTNLLLAGNFYQACSDAIEEKRGQILDTQYEVELKEHTLLPETVLQSLVDDYYIYAKLEKRLESIQAEEPVICTALYRRDELAKDILFISFIFGLNIPQPTQSAQNLANAFVGLNTRELLVAYYTFHLSMLAPFRHNENLKIWLARNGKSGLQKAFFSTEPLAGVHDFLLVSLNKYFSEMELREFEFKNYRFEAETLVDLMINVKKEMYNSEFVRNANKPTLTSTYNEQMASCFESKL